MHLMKIVSKAPLPITDGIATQLCKAWLEGWDAKCDEVVRVKALSPPGTRWLYHFPFLE